MDEVFGDELMKYDVNVGIVMSFNGLIGGGMGVLECLWGRDMNLLVFDDI